MCSGSVLVSPRIWPDTTDTAPNSPIARALHSRTPYNSPHLMLGRVMRRNSVQAPAPSDRAVSSSSLPCCSMSGISSRTTNGKVMNNVASTIAGRAKRILMSCAISHSPNQPCDPNSNTRHKPATTGDTANGRSINASSRRLPRNSKRVTAQALSSPKTALSGMTIAAVSNVSFTAARASGCTRAANQTPNPLPKAAASTITSGSTTSSSMMTTASRIISQRIHAAPSSGSLGIGLSITSVPGEKRRDRIDDQQADERCRQQQRGDPDRAVVVVFLQSDRDQQRCDLGLERQVAGDEDHRAVFAEPACECQRKTGQQSRQQVRQDHAPQRGEAARAERCGRFLGFASQRLENRLHGAHGKGQADEDQRDDDAGCRVGDLDAVRLQQPPDPSVGGVDRRQRNAGDGRRQRERQIDKRVEQAPSREAVTHHDPRDERAGE